MNRYGMLAASLLVVIAGLAILTYTQIAFAVTMQTRGDYNAALDRATAVYKDARAKCATLAGHKRDMCVVEAKAAEKRTKAAAEAKYKGTTQARTDSRVAQADADYMVAKVACDAKSGAEKGVCVKQAQATQIQEVADAKANTTFVDPK
jgi:hypothetical protein